MLKVENIRVYNIGDAIRGMRNPMQSYDRSDTIGDVIGGQDLKLAQKLIKAGTDHSKFMRQIFVSMDITAPRFWWMEMDTYKVATTANSESTMHCIHKKPFTLDDFTCNFISDEHLRNTLRFLNYLRNEYLKTNSKVYWRAMIEALPQSYNQKRTWTANYQVLRNIYFARKNHKLFEWHEFCKAIEDLPYGKELIFIK